MLRKLLGRPKPPPPGLPGSGAPRPADAARPLPVDVTDVDFAQVVAAHAGLAVVDFWADWCEPCRPMSAYVAFLAADYAGRLLVAALDVDENPATAEQYQVMGLPTLLFVRGGGEVARIVGLAPYDEIKRQVEGLLADKL